MHINTTTHPYEAPEQEIIDTPLGPRIACLRHYYSGPKSTEFGRRIGKGWLFDRCGDIIPGVDVPHGCYIAVDDGNGGFKPANTRFVECKGEGFARVYFDLCKSRPTKDEQRERHVNAIRRKGFTYISTNAIMTPQQIKDAVDVAFEESRKKWLPLTFEEYCAKQKHFERELRAFEAEQERRRKAQEAEWKQRYPESPRPPAWQSH